MATNQADNANVAVAPNPTCMESVNRIAKLPVVESTIQTATNIYEKVKDYNSVTNWTLSTAECTVNKAVETGKPYATPVMKTLDGPIKKVDNILCTGLDYVESKVPAVKLPPGEIYTNTKDFVNNTITPAVECAKSYAEPAMKTAKDYVEPAMQTAKSAVEPAVERAKHIVEPLVQPTIEKTQQLIGEFMHKEQHSQHQQHQEGDNVECQDCNKSDSQKKSN